MRPTIFSFSRLSVPRPPEGGHGAAQRVRLVRRELCRLHGEAHRLLLEQRHAEGFFEHPAQLVGRAVLGRGRGVDHLLQPVAAAQVGMHHVALDRAGAHDRHLDHQVVEAAGLEPRQHVHLRPALDLEDADRIRPAQHVVDLGVVLRHRGECQMQALVLGQQREGFADAGQHAEPQHVDLHQPERLEVVLVPFDEGAVLHRAVADGHHLRQRPARQHEAADMLREMAGEADQLGRERNGPAQQRISGVEPGLAQAPLGTALPVHVPQRAGEGCGGVLREPHGLAHVPRRAPPPVGDDGGGEACALATVAAVDVLDHLLAPLVLEVHVDIGGLAALARDEALEQQVDLRRVDGGDPQAVADGGVGGGAPSLAEDALAPGEAHDVVHGEEVGRVAELGDERELVHERAAHLGRDAAGIALRGALPGQRLQVLLRRGAGGHRFLGILVGQLVETEAAEVHDLQRAGDGILAAPEEPRHLGPALEMALGVGGEAPAGVGYGDPLTDRGQHVLQRPAHRHVVVHVVGGDERCCVPLAERREAVEAAHVVAPVEHVGGEVERAFVAPTQRGERRRECLVVRAGRRQRDQHLALGVRHHVARVEHAAALGRAPLAEGEQAAESAVGGAVAGVAEEREAAGEIEPRASEQP